jgi:hypothetical protein
MRTIGLSIEKVNAIDRMILANRCRGKAGDSPTAAAPESALPIANDSRGTAEKTTGA